MLEGTGQDSTGTRKTKVGIYTQASFFVNCVIKMLRASKHNSDLSELYYFIMITKRAIVGHRGLIFTELTYYKHLERTYHRGTICTYFTK